MPKVDRRIELAPTGCRFCGCKGCNPKDKKRRSNSRELERRDRYERVDHQEGRIRERRERYEGRGGREFRERHRDEFQRKGTEDIFDPEEETGGKRVKEDWHQVKQEMCKLIEQLTRTDAHLVGMAFPMRRHSYINGRPGNR